MAIKSVPYRKIDLTLAHEHTHTYTVAYFTIVLAEAAELRPSKVIMKFNYNSRESSMEMSSHVSVSPEAAKMKDRRPGMPPETFVMTAEAVCDRVDIEHVINAPHLLWQG